jgi:hypothetical protein
MHDELTENPPSWPREITICPTDETVMELMPNGYNPDNDGGEALLWNKGWHMETLTIESWGDLHLSEGFEIWGEDDRAEYEDYIRNKA